MAFCNQCGSELPEGARFCAKCGAPVPGNATPTTVPEPAAPAAPQPQPATQSFRQPAPPAIGAKSGGGLGWVLPLLVGLAALAIAYLLFAPARPVTDVRQEPAAGGRASGSDAPATEPSGGEAAAPRSSAAAAGDAADDAAASARSASGTVSAAVLDSAFYSNPDGAAARYAGPIRVSGTIATMVQPGATPSLSMEGRTRFNYMVVNFPAGYRERLAPLYKGQFITVSCDEVRSLGGTTILSGCLLG